MRKGCLRRLRTTGPALILFQAVKGEKLGSFISLFSATSDWIPGEAGPGVSTLLFVCLACKAVCNYVVGDEHDSKISLCKLSHQAVYVHDEELVTPRLKVCMHKVGGVGGFVVYVCQTLALRRVQTSVYLESVVLELWTYLTDWLTWQKKLSL